MSPIETAAHLCARHTGDFEQRRAAASSLRFDLDFLVVQFARAQLLAEGFARGCAGARSDQRVEHALLGGELCLGLHILAFFLARLRDADLNKIADDLFDVAPDIADFGEFRRLDLDEGCAGQPRQTPRNLGLADARWVRSSECFSAALLREGVQ